MKKIAIVCLVAIAVFGSACKKHYNKVNPSDETTTDFTKLKVNPVFDWTAAKPFSLRLTVTDNSAKGVSTDDLMVQLLDQDFNRVKSGMTENGALELNVKLPTAITKLYVFIPKTGNIEELRSLSSPQIINMGTVLPEPAGRAAERSSGNAPTCDCESKYTVSGSVSSLTIKNNETICLTGSLKGGVTFEDKGTLKICGTANIDYINFNGSGKGSIIITSTGTLNSSNLNINNKEQSLVNYGKLNITSGFSPNGPVENYGTMTVKNDMAINGDESNTFVNHSGASLTVGGNFQNNKSFTNDGTCTVEGEFSQNSNNKKLTNSYALIVKGNFNMNGTIENKGYISVGAEFRANSGSLHAGSLSMISVNNFVMNNIAIHSSGEGSIIKVKANGTLNSGSASGKIDFKILGKLTKNVNFPGNVYFGNSDIYIPSGGCNPEGYGQPQVIDTDKDGVADLLDEFPTDANRAYSSKEPYIGYKVNTFEDLWPSTGDYDFNDVVIKTKTIYYYNAKNELVNSESEMVLSAMGGSLVKGLSLQYLNLSIEGLKSTYTQMDIKKYIKNVVATKGNISPVVDEKSTNSIRITDNLFEIQSSRYSNTGFGFDATPDTFKWTVNYNSGFAIKGKTNMLLDFFLTGLNNEKQSYEIHVADRPATAGADTKLFGTFEDNTVAAENRWYKSAENHPWAIELYPGTGNFSHPYERNSILLAYPSFAKWASSGGVEATDWYLFPNKEYTFIK